VAWVTGIGGIFLKAENPGERASWYQRCLGMKMEDYGGIHFDLAEEYRSEPAGYSI